MTPPIDAARARRARIAVSMLFFSHGAIAAAVFPRLPAIKESLGLTNAELGIAVAGLPIGGLLAGGLAGAFIVRAGSPRVAVLSGVAAAFTLAAIGLASSWAMLFAAYLVYGMFDATMDAAMNTHGLGVQRVYGRSILQRFHGLWSVGGMAAGAAGAITAGLAIAVAPYLARHGHRAGHHRPRRVPPPAAGGGRRRASGDGRRRRGARQPAPRGSPAPGARADRDARDPVHRPPERRVDLGRGLPHGRARHGGGHRRRRVRRVHHGDGGRAPHE